MLAPCERIVKFCHTILVYRHFRRYDSCVRILSFFAMSILYRYTLYVFSWLIFYFFLFASTRLFLMMHFAVSISKASEICIAKFSKSSTNCSFFGVKVYRIRFFGDIAGLFLSWSPDVVFGMQDLTVKVSIFSTAFISQAFNMFIEKKGTN